jgi:choline dehydrogenase-like flavoprotein
MIAEFDMRKEAEPLVVDLCIIGGGAAGIAMARHFAGSKIRVALLESGGYKKDAVLQSLYKGDNVGLPYFDLHECRTRRFGGSTNCWGGMCTPMTAIDFAKRSWVPHSGWPFDEHELDPYMRGAHQLCGIGPYGYDERVWRQLGRDPLPFEPHLLDSHFWQMNSRFGTRQIRFAKKFHEELESAPNLHVLLHANVIDLVLDSNLRRLDSVKVKTRDNHEQSVRARAFVLACGGIENARLLLASDRQMPHGVGNQNDLVGRYFQEHLQTPCATVIPPPADPLRPYAQWWQLGQSYARPGLTLSPIAQEAHETLNVSVSVDPVYDERYLWTAAKAVWDDVVVRQFTPKTLHNVVRALRQSPAFLPDAYRRVRFGARPMGTPIEYTLYARAEQTPNYDSRMRLSDEKDQLGIPRVVLDWRTTELDHKSFATMVDLMKSEFARLRLGEVRELDWVREGYWPDTLLGGPHHMGTTRMSDDPKDGVVDRDAKVHGIDGLYLAGSSIFPTGGHANPTLTLLATTLRLCDHLETKLAAA